MTTVAVREDAYFQKPLTLREVLSALDEAVADYGADHIDPGVTGGACLYQYSHVKAPNGGTCRCLVGEIVWRTRSVQIPPNAQSVFGLIDSGLLPIAETEVRVLLAAVQREQDNGSSWGALRDEVTS